MHSKLTEITIMNVKKNARKTIYRKKEEMKVCDLSQFRSHTYNRN